MANMTQEEYVKENGGMCPACRWGYPDNLKGEIEYYGDGLAKNILKCLRCKTVWCETYTLHGYEIEKQGEIIAEQ
jgi:hypothetical protein